MDFDIKDIMRSILERESKAILDIPVTDDYEKAVGLIVEHVKGRGGKLVASGMGKAGQIAMNIATTFASTASRSIAAPLRGPAWRLGYSSARRCNAAYLQFRQDTGDSRAGGTDPRAVSADSIHRYHRNAESPLAALADVTLFTGGAPEVCPLGLTPTSTTMMTVIGDILVVSTMKATGFTRNEYAKRHHGGYLGVQARK